MNTKKGNIFIPIAIVVAGLLIAGAVMFGNRGGAPIGTDDSDGNQQASSEIQLNEVTSEDHIRGDINAPIKIVEFSDTECPFCQRFHETMKQVLSDYEGQVSWVYRHWPIPQLHPRAFAEAHASECVAELGGEEKFWEYLDAVYASKPTTLDVAQLAEDMGINREEFQSCQDSGRYSQKIQDQSAEAIAAGGRGTPHSIIVAQDGALIPIEGAQSYASLKSALDQLLATE